MLQAAIRPFLYALGRLRGPLVSYGGPGGPLHSLPPDAAPASCATLLLGHSGFVPSLLRRALDAGRLQSSFRGALRHCEQSPVALGNFLSADGGQPPDDGHQKRIIADPFLWLGFQGAGSYCHRSQGTPVLAAAGCQGGQAQPGPEPVGHDLPEGSRHPWPETGRFNRGAAFTAQAAGVPVLPIAHDAGRYWPADDWIKKPGTIRVKVGPAQESQDCSAKELTQNVRQWIMDNQKTH